MVLEPKNLNSVDEDIAQRKVKEKNDDIQYHRQPFLRQLANTLIVLGILAVVVVIFIVFIVIKR